ncbi:MAG: tetratricopeptide repeat protein [Streptosporangiaceae bacterium]|nr:tetratricopeptide repeat protein [Streptosporangiaceae bacterium]
MSEPPKGFGEELRSRRQTAGLSLAELATRIHYSKSHLSKVENGHTRPDRVFAEACDTALGASGALIALLTDDARPRGIIRFSGLPAATRYFVGRVEELTRIGAALLDQNTGAAVCVLHGMAGVGKTALALRAAWDVEAQFPDGCLFFDLNADTVGSTGVSSAEALDRLLHALGVFGEDIPRDTDGKANLYRDRLRGRRMLLVLDNIHSVRQVAPLLPAEPRCGVLITSRNSLNALDDAVHVPVDILPVAQAIALFRDVGGMRVPDDDEVVARIVEYCGRLPLAVRIAAARFRSNPTWMLCDFAARLADEAHRLRTLDDGERSVSAAFSLSYRNLSADQRRMFGLLSLHPGRDIAIRAAAALAGAGLPETEHLLRPLCDAHLIIQRPSGYVGFHDLVRVFATEYALPTLPAAEQDAAMCRLLDLVLFQTAASDSMLTPHRYQPPIDLPDLPDVAEGFTDKEEALAWLDAEWPSLVALCGVASAHGRHERCWQLAFFLRDYFFHAKLWAPWIVTHQLALTSARLAGDDRATAMTLNNLGIAHVDSGNPKAARNHYTEALRLFRSLADEHGAATARSNLAWANLYLGNHMAALRHLKIALDFYRSTGATRNAAITLRGIALTEAEMGSFTDALRDAEQAHDELRELELELDMAMALNCIAWIHFRANRYREAATFYERAVESGERIGSRHEVARAQTGLGNVAAVVRDHMKATELWSLAGKSMSNLSPVVVGEARARHSLENTS